MSTTNRHIMILLLAIFVLFDVTYLVYTSIVTPPAPPPPPAPCQEMIHRLPGATDAAQERACPVGAVVEKLGDHDYVCRCHVADVRPARDPEVRDAAVETPDGHRK